MVKCMSAWGRVIIINGDVGCGLLAACIGELVAQDSWLRPKVDSCLAPC